MKECTKCGETKELSSYHRYNKNEAKTRAQCKTCLRSINNKRHTDSKDGYYVVYYLPEEHYVGYSCNTKKRFTQHRANGKCTDGYEIVARFNNPYDAIILEAELHRRDYNGFTYKR
mgnify:CR=1 FL=1